MIHRVANAIRRNPYPLLGVVRRLSPVLHNRIHRFWMLFDYDSVKRALNDPETFSSRAAPPGGEPLDWLIFQDPPTHTKLRALIMRTFTPRAIAALEPRIAELSRTMLDPLVARGHMDVSAEYAALLPLIVIADMLGVAHTDRRRLTDWSDAILGLSQTIAGGEIAARAGARYASATAEMRPYVAELIAQRRAEPRDDLLTRLVESEIDGERLDEHEILSFFQLLLLAGSETTTNLIGNAMRCLVEHPDQQALLRGEPARLPGAIEEVLRYRAPVQMVFRATKRDVAMRGRTIPAGQLVLLMLGAANRDPKHFVNADHFDILRSAGGHVGFGHGIHFCLGAALARLEARVALGQLLERLDDIRITGPWVPQQGWNVHGPARLAIRFRARQAS